MMKKILLILLVAFTGTVIAQTPKVNVLWEQTPNKETQGKNTKLSRYLGEDENAYYYAVSTTNKMTYKEKHSIVKYDKETLQSTVKPLDNFPDARLYNVCRLGNETYIRIMEDPYKKTSRNSISRFNKQKMDFEFVVKSNDDVQSIYTSPNETKVLMVSGNIDEKHNVKQKFKLEVFDNRFNKLWEKELETPFFNNSFSNSSVGFALDNDGNVYLTGKVYKEKLKNVYVGNDPSDYTDYTFTIIKLLENGEKQQEFTVDMNGHLYNKCNVEIDKQNNILVFGLYSDRNMKTTGVCYFLLDKDFKTTKNLTFQEIPLKFLLLYVEASEAKEEEKHITERFSGFRFSKLFYAENDDIIMYAENKYSMRGSVFEASNSDRYITKAQDVYVFRINADKTLAWMKRVPKNQRAIDDVTSGWTVFGDGAGCLPFLSGDNFSLLFADSEKNLTINENSVNAVQERIGGETFVCVTLDKDGKQTKKTVTGIKENGFIPGLGSAIFLTNDSYLVEEKAKDNSKRKLGKIWIVK